MLNTVSKIRGQVKATGYPQTEGLLGDCMLRYGRELGEESAFGKLVERCDDGCWYVLVCGPLLNFLGEDDRSLQWGRQQMEERGNTCERCG